MLQVEEQSAAARGLAHIRRIRDGGPVTNNERKHAVTIRTRLDCGDLTTSAQIEFMEAVESNLAFQKIKVIHVPGECIVYKYHPES